MEERALSVGLWAREKTENEEGLSPSGRRPRGLKAFVWWRRNAALKGRSSTVARRSGAKRTILVEERAFRPALSRGLRRALAPVDVVTLSDRMCSSEI